MFSGFTFTMYSNFKSCMEDNVVFQSGLSPPSPNTKGKGSCEQACIEDKMYISDGMADALLFCGSEQPLVMLGEVYLDNE